MTGDEDRVVHIADCMANGKVRPKQIADWQIFIPNRTSRHWHTDVGAILVIALEERRQQQGEYKIRPYGPPDLLYQSSVA